MKAIQVEKLKHQYLSKKNGITHSPPMLVPTWHVDEGEHIFLYGNSGSGKTSLLNLLCGILTPNQGSIKIFGQEISALSNQKRDLFRAKNIAVVFQGFNLITYLSVIKNIQLACFLANNKNLQIKNDILNLLSKLHLPKDILHKAVSELSMGQQQRVAIARALINKPRLLLLDEPTSALDASARDAFMSILLELCKSQKMTVIFVSHDEHLKPYFSRAVDIRSISKI